MFIKELKLQEGIFSSSDTFEKTTLIYSQKNTKGKSTYLRLMFYSLGYQIPSMKGVEYSNINTELVLNERGKDFYINRAINTISVKTLHKYSYTPPNTVPIAKINDEERFL